MGVVALRRRTGLGGSLRVPRRHSGTTNIGLPTADGPVGNNCNNLVNFSKFNDPEINKDLETGRESTDPTVRKTAYEDINKEFAKQVWEAWGY